MTVLHTCRHSPRPTEIPPLLVQDGYEDLELTSGSGQKRVVRVPKMVEIESKWMPRLEVMGQPDKVCGYHAQATDVVCEGCPKRG